jgi:hypothetical protein
MKPDYPFSRACLSAAPAFLKSVSSINRSYYREYGPFPFLLHTGDKRLLTSACGAPERVLTPAFSYAKTEVELDYNKTEVGQNVEIEKEPVGHAGRARI